MTREDVLRIGRQAGAFIEAAQEKDLLWLERFAALLMEECAKVCDDKAEHYEDATQVKRGAVSVGGLVLWWSPEQPVAYPVAQPERVVQGEPVAWPTMPPRKQADQYCLDVLVSKLANVRSIAARRLPSVDVATIDDAITVLRTRQQPEPAVQGEPVYQCQSADGRWTDQTRESYEYNARHASDKIRVLYTRPSVPLTREAIQQAFEAWIKTDSTLPVTKQRHGYTNFTVALQWHAWQAAHKTGCE